MTESLPLDPLERLATLRRQFGEALPARIAALRARWEALCAAWDPATAAELHRQAHSLAGTAGTMGYPEVGHAARMLERLLKLQLGAEVLGPADRSAISVALARLAAAPVLSAEPAARAASPESTPVRLTILLADDDAPAREFVAALLAAQGHRVLTAAGGRDAVRLSAEHEPDLVLLDVVMPDMDGYAAVTEIKRLAGNRFVPVLFVTGLVDEAGLARGLAAGGDDVITKPVSPAMLAAKIQAMNRIREHERELAEYRRRTEEEIALSRRVFEAITGRNPAIPEVRTWTRAAGHFSGDLALWGRCGRRLFLFLGDFTGHGLAAAIGAIPAADVFYAGVAAGLGLAELVAGINASLHRLLPRGRFCAAAAVELDPEAGELRCWNGGLPAPRLLTRTGPHPVLASRHLPLGILGPEEFDAGLETLPLRAGRGLVLFTDGLVEAPDPAGRAFGEAGLDAALAAGDPLAEVPARLMAHLGAGEAPDDVSLVLLALEGN